MLPADLSARLRDVGVDPERFGDPSTAWARLRERFGIHATLEDRYALEAAARGTQVPALGPEQRQRAALQVAEATFPGFELLEDAARPAPDPIEVLPYDPAWPGRYAAWRDLVAEALGPKALRIEHVGSTSVVGLVAKPVIDIQVSVASLDDEPSYVPALERLGLRLRSRDALHRYFRPPVGAPRVVQVHVCTADGTWEHNHLLFREYLSAHPEAARAYGELKQALAERHRFDRLAYTDAKTEFITDALERARTWRTCGAQRARNVV